MPVCLADLMVMRLASLAILSTITLLALCIASVTQLQYDPYLVGGAVALAIGSGVVFGIAINTRESDRWFVYRSREVDFKKWLDATNRANTELDKSRREVEKACRDERKLIATATTQMLEAIQANNTDAIYHLSSTLHDFALAQNNKLKLSHGVIDAAQMLRDLCEKLNFHGRPASYTAGPLSAMLSGDDVRLRQTLEALAMLGSHSITADIAATTDARAAIFTVTLHGLTQAEVNEVTTGQSQNLDLALAARLATLMRGSLTILEAHPAPTAEAIAGPTTTSLTLTLRLENAVSHATTLLKALDKAPTLGQTMDPASLQEGSAAA